MDKPLPDSQAYPRAFSLTLVVPCYNEEHTLAACIERVQEIADDQLQLEIIIVNDASTDKSLEKARELEATYSNVRVLSHDKNQGKGAALRTGFEHATGEFVGVQDADLEYDPMDLRRLVRPLVDDRADVVFGSRYLSQGERRVLYFWHSLMNRGITLLSNMFTDMGLTDVETCYKLFKREIIQAVDIKENRFGFEPEITAKVGQMRCRVYEAPISYQGRTYAEGKKINWKDGMRALYCILHYGAPKAPMPVQFLIYLFVGGAAAVLNLLVFLLGLRFLPVSASALIAFYVAAAFNYFLCVHVLFRTHAYWKSWKEYAVYYALVTGIGLVDLGLTLGLMALGMTAVASKLIATAVGLVLNFLARKYLVFPEKSVPDWE